MLKNKLYGYADDPSLCAVVPSHSRLVSVAESTNRDFIRVSSQWCDFCGIKLNAIKTKTMPIKSGRSLMTNCHIGQDF